MFPLLFKGMMVGGYMWGYLADRRGRRNILVVSLTINGVFGSLASLAPTFWLFLLLRFLSGIGWEERSLILKTLLESTGSCQATMTCSCQSERLLEQHFFFSSAESGGQYLSFSPISPSSCPVWGEEPWSVLWPHSGWQETSCLQVGSCRKQNDEVFAKTAHPLLFIVRCLIRSCCDQQHFDVFTPNRQTLRLKRSDLQFFFYHE